MEKYRKVDVIGLSIHKDLKNGFLSLNDLLEEGRIYQIKHCIKKSSSKLTRQCIERIYYVTQCFETLDEFTDEVDKKGIYNVLVSVGWAYKHGDDFYLNPTVWATVAKDLNNKFASMVIIELIHYSSKGTHTHLV